MSLYGTEWRERGYGPNQIFAVAQEAADGTGAQRSLRRGRQEEKRTRESAGTSFCSSEHFNLNAAKLRALITRVVVLKSDNKNSSACNMVQYRLQKFLCFQYVTVGNSKYRLSG
jgi:hypothetical protein